jgi:hypothetical protein
MFGGSSRPRRALIAALVAAVALTVAGLVRAQQTDYRLDEGDDLTITCPTQLTVEYDAEGGAVATCAPEATDASGSALMAEDSSSP